jgi:hypothetical protein
MNFAKLEKIHSAKRARSAERSRFYIFGYSTGRNRTSFPAERSVVTGNLRAMSALPPKADIGERYLDVRLVPIADLAALFDHLVGLAE